MLDAAGARTMVFVDAGYIYGVMRTFYQTERVDELSVAYEDLARLIRDQVEQKVGPVLRIRWYDAVDPTRKLTNPRAVGMANVAGVRLVEGHLVKRAGSWVQKAVDTALVADMLTIAFQRQVERLVLISGDEDMTPGVRAAQDQGLTVEVWSIESNEQAPTVSRELLMLADRHVAFDIADMAKVITGPEQFDAGLAGGEPPADSPAGVEVGVETSAPASSAVLLLPPEPPVSSENHGDDEAASATGIVSAPAVLAAEAPAVTGPMGAAESPPATTATLPDLYSTDQGAYSEPVDWDAVGAVTDVQRADAVGAAYAERWWSAATAAHREALASFVARTGRLPAELDRDLLRFAIDHDVDTWRSGWVKVRVRQGFMDHIASLSQPE